MVNWGQVILLEEWVQHHGNSQSSWSSNQTAWVNLITGGGGRENAEGNLMVHQVRELEGGEHGKGRSTGQSRKVVINLCKEGGW